MTKNLSELIKRCGNSFGQLHKVLGNEFNKMEDHWIMYPSESPPQISRRLIDKVVAINGSYPVGYTPEEAIEQAWSILQK